MGALRFGLFCYFLLRFCFLVSAQTCSSETFRSRTFDSCITLPYLSASLHWTRDASNGSLSIAYRAAASTSEWVAWGINPTGTGMVGTQALVGVVYSNGSVTAYTSSIDSLGPLMQPGNLSFAVTGVSAERQSGVLVIYANLVPPSSGNQSTANQVWQRGPVSGEALGRHPTSGSNLLSTGSVDFISGQGTTSGGNSRLHRRRVHGILCAVSWGTLMPLGAIIARYLRVVKSAGSAWFYLHIFCQSSAYSLGVAGWALGLKLGSDSVGVTYDTHRNIGITLFVFGTLQVIALFLRPKPDHKYRFYWNAYHHSIGYTTIILSIINVFKGLDILDPGKKWRHAYIGVICALGAIAVILEAITWPIVLKRKAKGSEKSHHGTNPVGGANAYGGRQHQVV